MMEQKYTEESYHKDKYPTSTCDSVDEDQSSLFWIIKKDVDSILPASSWDFFVSLSQTDTREENPFDVELVEGAFSYTENDNKVKKSTGAYGGPCSLSAHA